MTHKQQSHVQMQSVLNSEEKIKRKRTKSKIAMAKNSRDQKNKQEANKAVGSA